MQYKVVIIDEAKADIKEARKHYNSIHKNLGVMDNINGILSIFCSSGQN